MTGATETIAAFISEAALADMPRDAPDMAA